MYIFAKRFQKTFACMKNMRENICFCTIFAYTFISIQSICRLFRFICEQNYELPVKKKFECAFNENETQFLHDFTYKKYSSTESTSTSFNANRKYCMHSLYFGNQIKI